MGKKKIKLISDLDLLHIDDFTSGTFASRPFESSEAHGVSLTLCVPASCRFQPRPLARSHAPLWHARRKYSIVHAAQHNLVLHCDYSV